MIGNEIRWVNMRLVVYLDLLAVINLLMNYILLWATAKLLNLDYSYWRIFLASIAGTIYTVLAILPILISANNLLFHFLVSILMLLIAFGPLRLAKFLKAVGYFYVITFTTAGAVFALYNLTGGSPLDTLGSVFNISFTKSWLIVFAFLIAALIGKFGWLLIQHKISPEVFSLPTIIKLNDNQIKIKSLVDTGNNLKDPLTKVPVIVVEFAAVKKLFSKQVRKIFTEYDDQQRLMNQIIKTKLATRFRLVPFSSLGEENGMLIAFRPDMVVIKSKQEIFMVKKVVIALKMGDLNLEKDYQGLLNPALFSLK